MNLPRSKMIIQTTGYKNKALQALFYCILVVGMIVSYHATVAQQNEQMVRIAEIEIDPAYLEESKAILKEEAEASVKLEPGVISIFPMYQKDDSTKVKILEIYASKKAYEQHLKTPHFQKYKTSTLNMVKSLKLVDMEAIDAATMPLLFRKLK